MWSCIISFENRWNCFAGNWPTHRHFYNILFLPWNTAQWLRLSLFCLLHHCCCWWWLSGCICWPRQSCLPKLWKLQKFLRVFFPQHSLLLWFVSRCWSEFILRPGSSHAQTVWLGMDADDEVWSRIKLLLSLRWWPASSWLSCLCWWCWWGGLRWSGQSSW